MTAKVFSKVYRIIERITAYVQFKLKNVFHRPSAVNFQSIKFEFVYKTYETDKALSSGKLPRKITLRLPDVLHKYLKNRLHLSFKSQYSFQRTRDRKNMIILLLAMIGVQSFHCKNKGKLEKRLKIIT